MKAPTPPRSGKRGTLKPAHRLVEARAVQCEGALVAVELPLRLVSESNIYGDWRPKAARKKHHRTTAALLLRALAPVRWNGEPITVEITRIAPALLDDDNLAGAIKSTRDGVADWLGVDDRDKRIKWRCEQERGAVRTYGCRVVVRRRA